MMEVTDYKSFEELEESVKRLNERWKIITADSNKNLTFAGIQREMQMLQFFIKNERQYLEEDLIKLKELWSDKVIAQRREKLINDFNELVKKEVEATQQEIAALSSMKLEKIGDMLATAPSEEQLRLLQALQMRGDVDSLEVHHILPVFFNNYQSMRLLKAISEKNGIFLNLPVQLDCHTMFDNLKKATDYLLKACDELPKEWENINISYHAFFTTNSKEKDKQYDPVYQQWIDLFDNTPQLQECNTEKKHLSEAEKTRVDWCCRDIATLDPSNPSDYTMILKKIKELVTEQPDLLNLLRLSKYKDFVDEVDKPDVTDEIKENE